MAISAKGNFETICHILDYVNMLLCLHDLCHSSVSSAQAGKNSNISEEDVIKLRSWGKHTRQVYYISITSLEIKTCLFFSKTPLSKTLSLLQVAFQPLLLGALSFLFASVGISVLGLAMYR